MTGGLFLDAAGSQWTDAEALADLTVRYRSLFDDAPLGIALASAIDLRLLQVNPAFCRFLGYSAEELLADHTCSSITREEDRACEERIAAPALAGEANSYRMEKRFLRSDGTMVWGALTASFVRNPDGSIRYIFGIVEDIDARKEREIDQERTERELRQSQASLLEAQRMSRSGSWSYDPATTRVSWSDSLFDLFGVDPADGPLSFEELLALCSDEDARRFSSANRQAFTEGVGYEFDLCFHLLNGQMRWAHLVAETERQGEATTRIYGTLYDVTQRKEHEDEICRLNAALEQRVAERTAEVEAVNLALLREVAERLNAEEEIRERERQLQAVTDNTTTILARVDANQRYLFCNHALADRFFLTPQEMIGKAMWEVFPKTAYAIMRPHLERALAGQEVIYDAVLPYPNPGLRHVRMSYMPEFDERGEVKGLVISAADLTELYEAKEAASQTSQRLRKVFESISDGFVILDPEWRIDAMNGEAERVFGRSRAELIGRIIWEEFPELAESIFWTKYNESVSTKTTVTFEAYDARVGLWLEVRAFPSPEGLSVYFRDITQSRSDAEKLRLLNLAIESSSNGILIADAGQSDLPIVYVNPAFEQITGYHASDALGRNCRFLQAPEIDPSDVGVLRQALRDGVDAHVCLLNMRKDGTRFWNDVRISPVFEPSGTLTHFIGIQTDVTEQREADQKLRLLSSAIDNANDVIVITEAEPVSSPGPEVVYVNHAFTRETGYLPEDIIGKTPRILHGPETDRKTLDRVRKRLQAWKPVRVELRNYRKDGTPFWVELNIRPIANKDGWYTHWISVQRDITKRKEAEQERQRLAGNIRLLLESTEEGIYGLDLDGRCTFINQSGAKMLGYIPNELQGKNLHPILHHSYPDGTEYPQMHCPILKAFTAGEPCSVETEVFWHKNGRAIPVSYRSHPMKSPEGVVGAVVTFSDITERLAIERERERLLAEAIDRADRDPLTGLLNHRAFQRRLSEEADRALRTGQQLGVAIMDLNNFKFFNDAYGHLAGDEVLMSVSRALQSVCRSYDILARFGGDEFALLLPGITMNDRNRIVERLTDAVASVSYLPESYTVPIPLSISVGLAFFPDGVATRTEVLAAADEDLRFAKTGGDEAVEAGIQLRHELLATIKGYEMLNALVAAVDNKDRYTSKHSEDVMHSCLQIAQEFGWDDAQKRVIAIAALLHDVGKIGVPDKILRKPGRLTDDEFALMRQHPEMGAVIVAAVPGFEETLDAIRHHHESWDGTGYPLRLSGEDIPQIARIMAVADAFSAMTTNRPYRKGMPAERAEAILREGAGGQWDPEAVKAFLAARENLRIAAQHADP